MSDVIPDYILFNALSSPSTFFIIFDIRIHLRLKANEFSDGDATSLVLEFSNDFLIDIVIIWLLCYSSVSIMRPCMSLILAHAHFVGRLNLDQHGCRTLHMSCPSLLAILP